MIDLPCFNITHIDPIRCYIFQLRSYLRNSRNNHATIISLIIAAFCDKRSLNFDFLLQRCHDLVSYVIVVLYLLIVTRKSKTLVLLSLDIGKF